MHKEAATESPLHDSRTPHPTTNIYMHAAPGIWEPLDANIYASSDERAAQQINGGIQSSGGPMSLVSLPAIPKTCPPLGANSKAFMTHQN